MADNLKSLRAVLASEAEKAGEGLWFRKSDNAQCPVDVTFHPTTQRWITVDGRRRRISGNNLQRDFQRLQL